MGVSDLDLKAALPSTTMPPGKLFNELQLKPNQIDTPSGCPKKLPRELTGRLDFGPILAIPVIIDHFGP